MWKHENVKSNNEKSFLKKGLMQCIAKISFFYWSCDRSVVVLHKNWGSPIRSPSFCWIVEHDWKDLFICERTERLGSQVIIWDHIHELS